MRGLPRVLVAPVAALLILTGSTIAAGNAKRGEASPPLSPARVLLSLDLPGEMKWYYQNDVGMLLVAPSGMLTSQEGAGTSSYAFDTLGGKLLWEAPSLPPPDLVFSFPEIGLAVLRSFADGGSLTAVDLRSGKRKWDHAMPLETVWHDGSYLRLISEKQLLTLDISTGEMVRRDELTLPKTKLLRAFPAEGVLIAWSNKSLKAFSMPPAPPAAAAPGCAPGHEVKVSNSSRRQGSAMGIWVDPESGMFHGVADPRASDGAARGY